MDSTSSIELMIKEYAKGMSILVVDDDFISLEICKNFFSQYFFKVDFAKDGLMAYNMYANGKKNYDLIITDIMMPNMNGIELIEKIRLKSLSQHIIVLSSLNDLDELRDIITQGVDAIMLKPFDKAKTIPVLLRVVKAIYNAKKLHLQLQQLRLIAKDNIELKISKQKSEKLQSPQKVLVADPSPKVPPEDQTSTTTENKLISKYGIRASIKGGNASEFMSHFDEYDLDRVEQFLDNLIHFEANICKLELVDSYETKEQLSKVSTALLEFVQILNQFGSFLVASNAAETLVTFMNTIDVHKFDDRDKKELFVSIFLALLEDIEKWIRLVFIDQDASNINYFDASFANTCLELEAIFSDGQIITSNDDDLEFF